MLEGNSQTGNKRVFLKDGNVEKSTRHMGHGENI